MMRMIQSVWLVLLFDAYFKYRFRRGLTAREVWLAWRTAWAEADESHIIRGEN